MNQSLQDRLHRKWLESDGRAVRLIKRYGWPFKHIRARHGRRLQKHSNDCERINAKGERVWLRGQQ